jgi:hypothetical protein
MTLFEMTVAMLSDVAMAYDSVALLRASSQARVQWRLQQKTQQNKEDSTAEQRLCQKMTPQQYRYVAGK